MKIFLDSADVDEVQEAASMGILDGVTTNPSLVSDEDYSLEDGVREISELVPDGVVNAEVVSTEADEMVEEAQELYEIADNIVVKIPMIPDGIRAVSELSSQGIPTNVTLCFQPTQALMAAKAGATFVSPFIGRLDDRGHRGMDLIRQIRRIYDNYDFDTEILTASVRHPNHVMEAALAGTDIITLPYDVFEKLLDHPLTDQGLERFLSDWEEGQSN